MSLRFPMLSVAAAFALGVLAVPAAQAEDCPYVSAHAKEASLGGTMPDTAVHRVIPVALLPTVLSDAATTLRLRDDQQRVWANLVQAVVFHRAFTEAVASAHGNLMLPADMRSTAMVSRSFQIVYDSFDDEQRATMDALVTSGLPLI